MSVPGTTNIPVVGIIMRRNGKILFVLRQNTSWMDGFYGLPGGHVDPGESFAQAACREAKEEAGVIIEPNHLRALLTFQKGPAENGDGDIRTGIVFEAEEWESEPHNAEPDKHEHIAWIDPNDLPDNVIPETAKKLELIQAGQTYWEYGWDN